MHATASHLRAPALRPAESWVWRWTCVAFALVVLAVFFAFTHTTNPPAYHGVDQNGYLYGGRTLLEHGLNGYQPHEVGAEGKLDPYGFVARMWVGIDLGTENERYYPKYPQGLPVLVAGAWLIGGHEYGPWLTYLINPLAMTLGLWFSFLLIREVAGSTLAVLGLAVLASLPAILKLANNPNSHATAVCCAAGAMFFLFSWIRHAGWPRAVFAGFLGGYGLTIRYTEGLLLLPLLIGWAASWHIQRDEDDQPQPRQRFWRDGLLMVGAWGLPVGLQIGYNLLAFGALTGYDPCMESTGFSWRYAADNWLTMLEQFSTQGLGLFFTFALAGLMALWRWRWRLAAVLGAWTVPAILTYVFYYWAPDGGLGYMRFFVTVLPGVILAAMAMIAGLMEFGYDESLHITLRRFWVLITGAVVAVAVVLGAGDTAPGMLVDQVRRHALDERSQRIAEVAPPGSLIFAHDTGTLHHLQFVADYTLYQSAMFDHRRLRNVGDVDPNEPTPFQLQRQQALREHFKDKTPGELWAEARRIVLEAREAGYRTFVIEPMPSWRGRGRYRFSLEPLVQPKGWSTEQVTRWANTTVGDPAPGPRIPRRRDPLQHYHGSRDEGRLIEILPPDPKPAPPGEASGD